MINSNFEMNIDLLVKLISEEHPVDGHEMGGLEPRIKKISAILENNYALREDSELTGQIWTFSEQKEGPAIQRLREQLLFKTLCNIETLTLSEKELEALGDDLWEMLEKHGVQRLIIQGKGKPIVYGQRVLKQLIEKKPSIQVLTERCTVTFQKGELVETKATLLLCGAVLEESFELDYSATNELDLSSSPLTCDDFKEFLKEVKDDEGKMDEELYETVCDYLDYSRWTDIPEGVWGVELWKELDIEVTDVPLIPNKILELKDPENYQIVLIPPKVSIKDFEKIVQEKLNLKWYIWYKARYYYGCKRAKKAYWVAIRTKMDEESFSIVTRKEQIDYAKEHYEGHQAPSLLEAIACNVASYKKTGKSLLGMYNDVFLNYTCCREEIINGKELSPNMRLVVGGSPAGLSVNLYFDPSDSVGMAPLLREF